MTEKLFAAIRRAKVKPGVAGEFTKRVEAGALPVIAVSLFTNKNVAEASTAALMPWIKENLGPLLATPTEPIDGQVLVSAVA